MPSEQYYMHIYESHDQRLSCVHSQEDVRAKLYSAISR